MRRFSQLAALVALSVVATPASAFQGPARPVAKKALKHLDAGEKPDYIVVGSGAAGSAAAAGLVRRGFTVQIIEAGGDPRDQLSVLTPARHPEASLTPGAGVAFAVDHFTNEEQASRDPKLNPIGRFLKKITYPRGRGKGGSTAVNALILRAVPDHDWNAWAETVGDPSFRAEAMREHLANVIDKRYGFTGFFNRVAQRFGWPARGVSHEMNSSLPGLTDKWLRGTLLQTVRVALAEKMEAWPLQDSNSRRMLRDDPEGLQQAPKSTRDGERETAFALVEQVQAQKKYEGMLAVSPNTLFSRVLWDPPTTPGGKPRARAVEVLEGQGLYETDVGSEQHPTPAPKRLEAKLGVVLALGAFGTPQGLMLSGIGPREELEKHGIEVVVDSQRVGKQLAGRREIGVVHELDQPIDYLKDIKPSPTQMNKPFARWLKWRKGPYASNGPGVFMTVKSELSRLFPDVIAFWLPAGDFEGYSGDPKNPAVAPPYWEKVVKPDHNTWALLEKDPSSNGEVTLYSADPRQQPNINFNFPEDPNHSDWKKLVRPLRLMRRIMRGRAKKEVLPGTDVESDLEIQTFARDNGWDHHASSSLRMGRWDDETAPVKPDFSVDGVDGLFAVDASVAPNGPLGYFPYQGTMAIGDKAAKTIAAKFSVVH